MWGRGLGDTSGATRIPNVVAYLTLLGVLLGLYRFTSIGLDRVPDPLPCVSQACHGAQTSALSPAPASPRHLLVPVQLRGRRLSFLLDTGAESTVLARATASEHGWLEGARSIVGAVNDRFGLQPVLSVDQLIVAGHAFGGFDVTVIDMAGIRVGLGPRVDGVLGADVLSRQPFEIDFARPSLTLGRRDAAFARSLGPGERDTRTALQRIGGGWFATTRADHREALFLIDTGSNASQVGEVLAAELGGSVAASGRVLDAEGKRRVAVRTLRVGVLAVGDFGRRGVEVSVGEPNLLGADFFDGTLLRVEPSTEVMTVRARNRIPARVVPATPH